MPIRMPASLCLRFVSVLSLSLLLAMSSGVLGSSMARADQLDDDRAYAHFTAGESHFAAERWGDAAREFALAYEFSGRPEMLINLSRAHERNAQHAEALADLELLLSRHPETSYRAEAELRMTKLRASIAQEGAANEHDVNVRSAAAGPTDAAGKAASARTPEHDKARARSIWPPRPLTLALAGSALAVAVASLGTGLRAHGLERELKDSCPDYECDPRSSWDRERDRGDALAKASTGLMFVSLALAGSAAALWYYDVKARREHLQTSLRRSRTEQRASTLRETASFGLGFDGSTLAASAGARF
jgi:hypothetical protein